MVNRGKLLLSPSMHVHNTVVKAIRDQLNELKKEVEAKAAQKSSSLVSTPSNSSSAIPATANTTEYRSPTPY